MAESTRKIKLFHVTTVPVTQLLFLRGQVQFMKSRGFEMHAVSSPGKELDEIAARDDISVHPVPISRKISPFRDLLSIWRLLRLFRKLRPDIVHLSTPKAALLGAIAAAMASVPIRIFYIRGSITENARGLRRILYKASERLTSKLCHFVIAVSQSLLDYVRSKGIVREGRGCVLHRGSSNGIDGDLFNPDGESVLSESNALRSELGLPGRDEDGGMVISFIGRLEADKGIAELHQAWRTLKNDFPNLHLLLIGPLESENPVSQEILSDLESDERVHMTGFVTNTVPYYALSDVVVLPTYAEGFGNVLLEANAMRVPAVASRVAGCVDAIVDGVTGALVKPRDSKALADALRVYLEAPDLRAKHGRAGRERALRDFHPEDIWEALYREYTRLLREKGMLTAEEISAGE